MSSEKKPGIFEATIEDYGVGKTKAGKPQAMIRFSYQDEDNDNHTMTWYGSFNPGKATEITCEALATCGWTTNNPADLAKGTGSGVLNQENPVSITTKLNEYNGNVNLQVAYINPVGGGGFRDVMDTAEAVQAFAGLSGIGGAAAAARKKQTAPYNHAPGAANPPPTVDVDEPVPF